MYLENLKIELEKRYKKSLFVPKKKKGTVREVYKRNFPALSALLAKELGV